MYTYTVIFFLFLFILFIFTKKYKKNKWTASSSTEKKTQEGVYKLALKERWFRGIANPIERM